jgi:hypothetical protein
MLTKMTDADWVTVLRVFEASRSRRGDKGRDDKKFLSALHYCSTSAPISIRVPRLATKAMIQNQIARQHANAEYVRQSRIDPTPKTCPLSFQKFSTRAAPVSSRRSASSNDSNASRYVAKRPHRITARSSQLRSA